MKKEKKYYIITALITAILLIFIYTLIDAFHKTILISDSYSQYAALFSHLKNLLEHGGSIFYTFDGGLGGSFLGTFFYYLFSPFNLLVVFFKEVESFMLFTIFFKLTCTSLTALYFFRYHFQKESNLYPIIFSIIYVLIGFTTHYFFNIMWLDSVLMLPLFLVGIDKFRKEQKISLFLFSFVYILATNYYFGYMACIFGFLYFLYQTCNQYSFKTDKKKMLKKTCSYIGITILGILLSSFLLLPVIQELPSYARVNTQFMSGESFTFHGNILSFIGNFLVGNTKDIDFLNADSFYLYMSMFAVILVVFYFFNSHFSKKERILTGIMLGILYLSVCGNYFNYSWTAFSKPQYFNGRFVFFFNLFFLWIAFKSLLHLSSLTKKRVLLAILLLATYFLLFALFEKKYAVLIINLAVVISYLIIFLFLHKKEYYVPILLITFISVEVTLNSIVSLVNYSFTTKEDYQKQNDIYAYATKTIKEQDQSPFYRVETSETVPYNGPLYYNFRGIDIFLSTLSDDMANFFFDIGYGSGNTKKNTISYYSGNEVMDSLLGIRYHIYIEDFNLPTHYQLLDFKAIDDKTIRIYQNPTALSLGYMVNDKILEVEKDLDALMYQSHIIQAMTNNQYSIYTHIPLQENQKTYSYTNEARGMTCFYTAIDSSNGYNNPTLYINQNALYKHYDFEIICDDSIFDNDIRITYSNLDYNQHLGTFAAYYSHNEFKKAIRYLQENELNVTHFKDTKIQGTVTATKDKNILFTTIPYSSNWKAYANGKEVKTVKVLDYLLGIPLEEGTWNIELKYQPKAFYIGLGISSITLLMTILWKKKKLLFKK